MAFNCSGYVIYVTIFVEVRSSKFHVLFRLVSEFIDNSLETVVFVIIDFYRLPIIIDNNQLILSTNIDLSISFPIIDFYRLVTPGE